MKEHSHLLRSSSMKIDLHKFEFVVRVEVEVMMEHEVLEYAVADRSLLVQLNDFIQALDDRE